MREESESQWLGPRNPWLVPSLALVFVALECVALALMLRRIGIELPLGWLAVSFALTLVPAILLTLLLFSALLLQIAFYAGLKVMVPLLNQRSFDGLLWEIDSWLLFGLSPNVFFVNLLDNSMLLRFIDFSYGYFFFFSVLGSFPLFFSLRDDRLRTSFIVANILLWSSGAWLYLLVPSVGPAYRFHGVWDLFRDQFPVSTYWQKQLLNNYEMILQMARGVIDPDIDLFKGIGAFPSLHVGFQTLFALYVGKISRSARVLTWLLVLVTFLGSIVTGWHYMVDSIAGLALAVGIYFLLEHFVLAERDSGPEAA